MRRTARLLPILCLLLVAQSTLAGWGDMEDMHDFHETFRVPEKPDAPPYRVTPRGSNVPGNILHPGERLRLSFQVENLIHEPLRAKGYVELVRYAQLGVPGDNWHPRIVKLADEGRTPIEVALEPAGWADLTVDVDVPETKGGYALIVDLGGPGRRYLASCIRTFKPDLERIPYPKQSLESMPPPIMARLGVQAMRYGVSFHAMDVGAKQRTELMERLDREFRQMHEHKLTATVEIGAGRYDQPLGRGRPHLDENGVMLGGKEDLCWPPKYDDEYQQFVYDLAVRYGYPKGPINGFMLWNEPWEGKSISGWQADIPRYRELYRRMGEAVVMAREDAGVQVLVGGCDSSTNTWDKLFADGSDEFLKYLDFCSIHYQGLSAPVLHPEWNNRTAHLGRVLIWDTESWVANTDDRFIGVVATNRAAGYDRSMGTLSRVAVSTLSHHRIRYDKIRTPDGVAKVERPLESRPLAAVYGAVQHFIGERAFDEILFTNGLPWVYTFKGLDGSPDDGTVVVLGDLESLFGGGKREGSTLFHTVRSSAEVEHERQLRRQLEGLPPESEERAALVEAIKTHEPLVGATMTLPPSDEFTLYDFYGNPIAFPTGRIAIPLDDRSFFLRADPEKPGSFGRLLDALRFAKIEGLEPLEIIAHDMLKPIAERPVLRLRVTNQRNAPIAGNLRISLGDLEVEYPRQLQLSPREQRWIEVSVIGGEAVASNSYPLEVVFQGGEAGVAEHHEVMHVNWIAKRSPSVDGRLDDWNGALPQAIHATDSGPSFEEEMYLPFAASDRSPAPGSASAYLAYDDENFYFAAKIADDTPHPGAVRFATRDEDDDFYPEVSYGQDKRDPERLVEHRWPEGVRRYSYRRFPDTPSGTSNRSHDNVLLGFNVIPRGEDGWESHLPGRMPKFVAYKTTDYEFALNHVASEYGGGTEVYRLQVPGMPLKHHYPRQPKHPLDGPVEGAKLAVRYADGFRFVEAAIPWKEIPCVRQRLDAGKTIKFSYRVNDQSGIQGMELARERSAAEGISDAFRPSWNRSWPNEIEFAFEPIAASARLRTEPRPHHLGLQP